MDSQKNSQKDFSNLQYPLPYFADYFKLQLSGNNYYDNSHTSIEKSLVQIILEEKTKSLEVLLINILSQIENTKSLENNLLSSFESNILNVENNLLQIDFKERYLYQNVIPLRVQMWRELFQLEQEKARTRIQLNNQLIQLSKETRELLKEINGVKIQTILFSQNG